MSLFEFYRQGKFFEEFYLDVDPRDLGIELRIYAPADRVEFHVRVLCVSFMLSLRYRKAPERKSGLWSQLGVEE